MRVLLIVGVIMSLLPFADAPQPQNPVQGLVVSVGKETVDISVGATVMRNVGIAAPLTIDQVQRRDIVAMVWYAERPFVTNVLGHESALRDDPREDTEPPPAPTNVRVTQGTYGVRLEWDCGGTGREKRDLSYYEIDGRLSGGDWGYNQYPVSEGTREVHYSDTGQPVQCRVRAVDFRGNESAWVVADTLLMDTVAPDAPSNLAIADSIGGVTLSWTGPTIEEVPDLAGYHLYYTSDDSASSTGWTGISSTVGTVAADTLSITHPMDPGTDGYFNLTAFDASGNESGYAESTWLYGTSQAGSGINFLVNSDFERDLDGDSVPDYWEWELSVSNAPTMSYGAYGVNGTSGIRASFDAVDIGYFDLIWPKDESVFKIPNEPGKWLTTSVHLYAPALELSDFYFDMTGENPPADEVRVRLVPSYHDGVSSVGYLHSSIDSYAVVNEMDDGWFRVAFSCTAEDHSGTGDDYLGFYLQVRNYPGTAFDIDVDRVKMEFDRFTSDWEPAVLPSTDGLMMDSAGLITADGVLQIGSDGLFYSGLTPAADDTYDLGGTNTWQSVAAGLIKAGDISAPDGASGTGTVDIHAHLDPSQNNAYDLGGEQHWKDVKYGGDLKPSRGGTEYTGQIVLDDGFESPSSDVTLSTSAQDCLSKTVTVPGGATLKIRAVFSFGCSAYTTAQNISAQIYIDGSNEVSIPHTVRNSGDWFIATPIYHYTPASEESVTFKMRAWKSSSSNTVRFEQSYSRMEWEIVG